MASNQMPIRSSTNASNDDDVIGSEDIGETTKLFLERLQAYKHACAYLEDYISSTEKSQASQAKEYEKVLKTVSNPLKEGDHFDQNLGGITEMFDNIRSNTQGVSHSHLECAKQLKGTVLPIFERLHTEIKNKSKELDKGVGKGSKAVDKARNTTQKHVELLGQHTATSDSAGGKVEAQNDPFVLHKGVYHRLHKQIQEENSSRQDMLTVQSNFSQFEGHVVQVFQQGLGHFMQAVGGQCDQQKTFYGNMVETAQRINPLHEWNGFVQRRQDLLIDPNAPQRSIDNVSFPNQNHRSTQALLQGSLQRKQGIMKKYEGGFYAITPAKFLHEYKTDDNLSKDPTPELSLYLPDCTVGGCQDGKFNVKGKDVSKGKFGNAMATNHEYSFMAHSPSDAEQWWTLIRQTAGHASSPSPSTVTSPTSPSTGERNPFSQPGSRNVSGAQPPAALDTSGAAAGQETGSVPASAASLPSASSGVEGKPGQY